MVPGDGGALPAIARVFSRRCSRRRGTSIGIGSGKTGLARIVEQFFRGVLISRFSTEILTRSQAKAKILAALNALERGLLYGDASTSGLLTIMECSADGLCSTLAEAYGRAIRCLVP
ncbi:MAG: hypothetical protein OZSIB_1605 [Candidatus Ozemobacter sibiricus]|uniref:Uncharacterized protein n=1 Tax=Candidatus Ozemobacter sibiricus TaxID=2268124 RepID=A0A367ZJK6_9BACT|nr:MAG: hypothetical protein OZSIB_1605 [Candidatus Ozemobacter sibiricus]